MAVAHALPTSERDFRGPGCGTDCVVVKAIVPGRFGRSELLLHSPEAHEEYGRATTTVDGVRSVVWTGPLVIDRWAKTAHLGHERVRLTVREWELLDYLASRVGRVCSVSEVAVAIWSDAFAERVARVSMSRLRWKLGPHAALIETQSGYGYRLMQMPPVETHAVTVLPHPTKPWSRNFKQCVCCGSAARQHESHGRCTYCKTRHTRWPHIGPCRMPEATP